MVQAEVPGFPMYRVSRDGRVFSFYKWNGDSKSFRELKQETIDYGYKRVTLYQDGKRVKVLVHRLVALAFLGESDLPEVRHLDDDTSNNHASNLAWSTKADNMADRVYKNGNKILSDEEKKEICDLYKSGLGSHRSLASRFGVTKEAIRKCLP
jgi:HNH endonuclease